jgi:hypothetical protein
MSSFQLGKLHIYSIQNGILMGSTFNEELDKSGGMQRKAVCAGWRTGEINISMGNLINLELERGSR